MGSITTLESFVSFRKAATAATTSADPNIPIRTAPTSMSEVNSPSVSFMKRR